MNKKQNLLLKNLSAVEQAWLDRLHRLRKRYLPAAMSPPLRLEEESILDCLKDVRKEIEKLKKANE